MSSSPGAGGGGGGKSCTAQIPRMSSPLAHLHLGWHSEKEGPHWTRLNSFNDAFACSEICTGRISLFEI